MTYYLIYAISYCHIFEYLPQERNVDYNKDQVQFLYIVLWRHKAPYRFYEVQSDFLSNFKNMNHGPTTPRLRMKASSFLVGNGVFKTLDDFNYVRLYGFSRKTIFIHFLCF
jgi:hypothetical protein